MTQPEMLTRLGTGINNLQSLLFTKNFNNLQSLAVYNPFNLHLSRAQPRHRTGSPALLPSILCGQLPGSQWVATDYTSQVPSPGWQRLGHLPACKPVPQLSPMQLKKASPKIEQKPFLFCFFVTALGASI